MSFFRRFAAIAAIVSATVLSQAAAPAAVAADYPVVVNFPTPSVTVEYGQSWSIPVYTDYGFVTHIYYTGSEVVSATGVPSGFAPAYYFAGPYENDLGMIYAPYGVDPLNVGSYSFSVSGSHTEGANTYTAQTPSPATLKIEKAKLGIDLRVLADESNADQAIVTAKFTGRFVDEYSSSFFDGAPLSPAGIWQITIKDESGQVAIESNVERAAGDDVLATSFYWTDAEPGENYTATAVFTPSGASANNFSVTPATSFSYTGSDPQRPPVTSTATSKPDVSLPEATGLGVPLWLLIVVGLLTLGLAALATVLGLRLRKRPAPGAEVAK